MHCSPNNTRLSCRACLMRGFVMASFSTAMVRACAGEGSCPSKCPGYGKEDSHPDHQRGDWRKGRFGGGGVCHQWVRLISGHFTWHRFPVAHSQDHTSMWKKCMTCNVQFPNHALILLCILATVACTLYYSHARPCLHTCYMHNL